MIIDERIENAKELGRSVTEPKSRRSMYARPAGMPPLARDNSRQGYVAALR